MYAPRCTRRLPWLLLLVAALIWGPTPANAREPNMPELRRKLEFAKGDRAVAEALDALTKRIGKHDAIRDHAAFASWLGKLPGENAQHALVLQRQGWAYVSARQGEKALAPLRASLKKDPGRGPTRAYLGEALRLTGDFDEAAEMFPTAVAAGYDEPHLQQSVIENALAIRRRDLGKSSSGLPPYAKALATWGKQRPDPEADALLGQWLLEDLNAYDKPSSTRGALWAKTAADALLRALTRSKTPIQGGAILALDAAKAVTALDKEAEGRSPHFDLLVWSVRLGTEGGAQHPKPQVYVLLADAALRAHRFELAKDMAQRRLAISHSPSALRVLRQLPPDLIE